MNVRIGPALAVALLAHAGAYAIILVTTPDKADIEIQGGSISISLTPTDSVDSQAADADGDEEVEAEADAVPDAASEPEEEEAPAEPDTPVPPDPEPEPEPVPEPEPEPEPTPEREPEPVPESDPEPPREPPTASPDPSVSPSESNSDSTAPVSDDQAVADVPSQNLAEHQQGSQSQGVSAEDSAAGATTTNSDTLAAEIGNAAADNYNGALMRHMRKARKFDTNARRSSKISITIDADGRVLEVKILRASGDKTWDRRVVKELKRIAPYPAPPSGVTHSWSFDAVPK
ncbi:MAG: TonB family protein [Pseudomonadota bacterium]